MAGQAVDELVPIPGLERIGVHVMNALAERLPLRRVELAVAEVLPQRRSHTSEVLSRVSSPRLAAIMRLSARHLAVAVAVVQRRQQLAHREIAGAAENNQVECVDRNQLGHGDSFAISVIGYNILIWLVVLQTQNYPLHT